MTQAKQRLGRRAFHHQRDIGDLVAAIGEIDARRRLGGPRDAREDDVGLLPALVVDAEQSQLSSCHLLLALPDFRFLPPPGGQRVLLLAKGQPDGKVLGEATFLNRLDLLLDRVVAGPDLLPVRFNFVEPDKGLLELSGEFHPNAGHGLVGGRQ